MGVSRLLTSEQSGRVDGGHYFERRDMADVQKGLVKGSYVVNLTDVEQAQLEVLADVWDVASTKVLRVFLTRCVSYYYKFVKERADIDGLEGKI